MKIAFASDDGETISAHFGRARLYVVFTVEEGVVKGREVREKVGHEHGHKHGHNHDHARIIAPISDCDVLVAGGMGMGAYTSLQEAGIRPILTDITRIEEAVQAYLSGQLDHHPERLH